jgi:hypothetical protein
MPNAFLTADETAALIRRGAVAVISGAEDLLAILPRGNWIGGTTVYFMTETGGTIASDRLFCSTMDRAISSRIGIIEPNALGQVTARRFKSGFTYVLMPAYSEVHHRYALEAASLPHLFEQPVMGWITGVHVEELGDRIPKVVDGRTGMAYADAGIALYVELPSDWAAEIDIINPFSQSDGPDIVFPETAFSCSACSIDGHTANFARFLLDGRVDTRLPLVANYGGTPVNVSVRAINEERSRVQFYAPVIAGETYRLAAPISDYFETFARHVGTYTAPHDTLASNCILNFLYAGLEGRHSGGFLGPVTFGEIAYILLNQTLVVLRHRFIGAAAARTRHAFSDWCEMAPPLHANTDF